jgi:hypothetical protein
MIWGKRQFQDAEYGPYMDKLSELMLADAHRANQYMMVSTEDDLGGMAEYYIGVPDEALMRFFDGFERVSESELPKEIDVLHLDAGGVQGFFTFRKSNL